MTKARKELAERAAKENDALTAELAEARKQLEVQTIIFSRSRGPEHFVCLKLW